MEKQAAQQCWASMGPNTQPHDHGIHSAAGSLLFGSLLFGAPAVALPAVRWTLQAAYLGPLPAQ